MGTCVHTHIYIYMYICICIYIYIYIYLDRYKKIYGAIRKVKGQCEARPQYANKLYRMRV